REQRGHAFGEERNERGRALGESRGARDLERGQRGRAFGEERNERNRGELRGQRSTRESQQPGTRGFAQAGVQGRVSLSSQQRTRIHNVVLNQRFSSRFSVGDVNFAVRVGTVIPRSFHLFVLPADIVDIVPRFRGFRFFILEEELVIVDPVTLEIVAIIPA
ncbi:MAG: hypothetical protein DMG21_17330, partial [Acidobacteria bacterium]